MENKQKLFDSLVNAFYKDIYRYAYWLCHSKPIAEDLVQETYLRAWKAIETLKDEKTAKAWLIIILRRENSRLYEKKRLETVQIDDYQFEDVNSYDHDVSETKKQLNIAIRQLDSDFREPLTLQIMSGFSIDEIASILDLNKNTVLTRLHRARSKLQKYFSSSSSKPSTSKTIHKGVANG